VPTPSRSAAAAFALTALLGASCASTAGTDRRIEGIQDLVREGEYVAAAEASADLTESLSEGSDARARAERLQVEVSIASGLASARELSLADRDTEALAIIEELDAAHPGYPVIDEWRLRTREKLGRRWFRAAREAVAAEDFDAARAAYARSIEYDPTPSLSEDLLADLARIEDYRAQVAEDLYYGGVRLFTDLQIAEAVNRFEAVQKYDEGNEKALRREAESKSVLADDRAAEGERLAAMGFYSAAAKEYVQANRLDPDDERISALLAELRVEAKVQEDLINAQSMVLRSEFDDAVALLGDALERTKRQRESVQAAIQAAEDARTEARYRRAVDLQYDFQFERALGVYDEILGGRDFYKDVRARADALRGYVADAERLYAAVEASEYDAEKLDLLRQIEVFWPDYRDVQERISALVARLDALEDAGTEESGSDESGSDENGSNGE